MIFGGYLWLIFAALHPTLPSCKKSVIFYSNHLRDDLKIGVLSALKQATHSITIHIYGLTDPDVVSLLEKKKEEGIKIAIFYDKEASKTLPKSLPAYPVNTSGLMHRKILIIDDSLVFLGTANFTTQSLKMHNNLVVGIWDQNLACFLRNSIERKDHFIIDGIPIQCFLLPDLNHQALKTIEKHLNQAKKTIQIAMFTLSHPKLLEKLISAHKRGVKVSIAIDRYTYLGASKKAIETLQNQGIEIRVHFGEELFHHKWALIDEKTLIMGSTNWTKSAFKKNQDCFLVFEELPLPQQKKLKALWKEVINATQFPES